MAALDLLGRRWMLRILWELLPSPAGFRDLQARCGSMSASVLSTRLQELRTAALVATAADGKWRLTRLGRDLNAALAGLQDWSGRWARELRSAPGPHASARRHSSP
jgi:DNA-binding HxlR family transcriptional regulator